MLSLTLWMRLAGSLFLIMCAAALMGSGLAALGASATGV
jgi:hypothetical protein